MKSAIIHVRPLNGPDTRTWWGKLMGELYEPTMPRVNGSQLLGEVNSMNHINMRKRRCRIAKVHIPKREAKTDGILSDI